LSLAVPVVCDVRHVSASFRDQPGHFNLKPVHHEADKALHEHGSIQAVGQECGRLNR